MNSGNLCPICGYPDLLEPAYFDSASPSYEICPSCGFQFGFTDLDKGFTFEQWRERWIHRGMPWDSDGIEPRPAGWDPGAQLNAVLQP